MKNANWVAQLGKEMTLGFVRKTASIPRAMAEEQPRLTKERLQRKKIHGCVKLSICNDQDNHPNISHYIGQVDQEEDCQRDDL